MLMILFYWLPQYRRLRSFCQFVKQNYSGWLSILTNLHAYVLVLRLEVTCNNITTGTMNKIKLEWCSEIR